MSSLPRLALLVVLAVASPQLSGMTGCADGDRPAATIAPGELAERIAAGEAPVILDVRSEQEFASGHLPGARNVPHDTLAGRLDELGLARDEEIVVHCQAGPRAHMAEQILHDAGYTHVRDLDGQWQGWREAGLPTE